MGLYGFRNGRVRAPGGVCREDSFVERARRWDTRVGARESGLSRRRRFRRGTQSVRDGTAQKILILRFGARGLCVETKKLRVRGVSGTRTLCPPRAQVLGRDGSEP